MKMAMLASTPSKTSIQPGHTSSGNPMRSRSGSASPIQHCSTLSSPSVYLRLPLASFATDTPRRHPCPQKPTAVSDIGLRLQEGIHELKLEQQLAPTREALSNAIQVGSSNLFKAMEGVRGRWTRRPSEPVVPAGAITPPSSSLDSPPVEVNPPSQTEKSSWSWGLPIATTQKTLPPADSPTEGLRPLSLVATQAATETKAALGSWGSGIGSFISSRAPRFSLSRSPSAGSPSTPPTSLPQNFPSSPPAGKALPLAPTGAPLPPVPSRPSVEEEEEYGTAL